MGFLHHASLGPTLKAQDTETMDVQGLGWLSYSPFLLEFLEQSLSMLPRLTLNL